MMYLLFIFLLITYGESSFISDRSFLWKEGRINYKFTDVSEFQLGYNDEERKLVRSQMEIIENQLEGCIQFIENKENQTFEQELLFEKKDTSCSATLGNKKQLSFANLGNPNCFNDGGHTILHELGHVLGKINEENRPDRDLYLDIDTELVDPSARRAFKIREERFGETYQTPYDFNSIMHGNETKGCGESTCLKIKWPYTNMRSLTKDTLKKYPDRLSAVDIVEIARAYNCTIRNEIMEEYMKYEKELFGKELIQASKDGEFDRVKELIKLDASLDEKDEYGKTGLNYAEERVKNYTEIVDFLKSNQSPTVVKFLKNSEK